MNLLLVGSLFSPLTQISHGTCCAVRSYAFPFLRTTSYDATLRSLNGIIGFLSRVAIKNIFCCFEIFLQLRTLRSSVAFCLMTFLGDKRNVVGVSLVSRRRRRKRLFLKAANITYDFRRRPPDPSLLRLLFTSKCHSKLLLFQNIFRARLLFAVLPISQFPSGIYRR